MATFQNFPCPPVIRPKPESRDQPGEFGKKTGSL